MLTPDTRFQDRYRILYVADSQPECTIYRATDEQAAPAVAPQGAANQAPHGSPGRQVLLAELPQEDEAAIRSTQMLAAATARLHAAGLLDLYNHFAAGQGCYYMAVADPGGQDLERAVGDEGTRALLQGRATGAPLTAQADRLLDVLAVLHSQTPPLLLGDLHAVDLWATPDGGLVLAPFALLRPIAAGNSPYRAPELEHPQNPPTPASDLYAVGAVLYHILTGWAPPTAALRRTGIPLNAPRLLNRRIPALLEEVLLRAMELQPADRYQTVAELRQALALVRILHDPAGPADLDSAEGAERLADVAGVAGVAGSESSSDAPAQVLLADLLSSSDPSQALARARIAAPPDAPPDAPPEQVAAPPPENLSVLLTLLTVLVLVALALCLVGFYFLVGPGRVFLFG